MQHVTTANSVACLQNLHNLEFYAYKLLYERQRLYNEVEFMKTLEKDMA